MYIYTYIYTYTYAYICAYICIYMYICICINACIYIYICTYIHIHMHSNIHIYLHTYTCIDIHIDIHIHTNVCKYTQRTITFPSKESNSPSKTSPILFLKSCVSFAKEPCISRNIPAYSPQKRPASPCKDSDVSRQKSSGSPTKHPDIFLNIHHLLHKRLPFHAKEPDISHKNDPNLMKTSRVSPAIKSNISSTKYQYSLKKSAIF